MTLPTAVRQGLGLVGIIVMLVGIALDNRTVVWVSMGFLGASVVLRFAARGRRHRGPDSPAP